VVVPVGQRGQVSIFNGSQGRTHLIADVLGWYPGSGSIEPTSSFMTEDLDPVDRNDIWYERAVNVQGVRRYNSLQLAGYVTTSPEWVEYNLGRSWGTLATTLTYDDEESTSDSVARFRILGDGVPLVDRTVRFGEAVDVAVNVTGVLRVRFEVTSTSSTRAYYPTFADPTLSR
jgi:hypothetical protein